jgi:hypothetical protein
MCHQATKALFVKHQVFTVSEMRWNGIKNGMLLSLCVENGFELLLTIDKDLMHQQNLRSSTSPLLS